MAILKKTILLSSVLAFGFILAACGTDTAENGSEETPAASEFDTPVTPADGEPGTINADGALELTLEELAYYDGTEDKRAYVAVEGFIYDMTDSSYWRNGGHNGYQAGQDLTDAINRVSPHGPAFLDRVPKIGIIVE